MGTRDTVTSLVEAAGLLVDAVERAEVVTGFTDEGNGPYAALCDGWGGHFPAPIRTAAKRLAQALLDHERACLALHMAGSVL